MMDIREKLQYINTHHLDCDEEMCEIISAWEAMANRKCENCKHWNFRFTTEGVGYGAGKNPKQLENIMVGNRVEKADDAWTFLGTETKAQEGLGLWVEFVSRGDNYCKYWEPKE